MSRRTGRRTWWKVHPTEPKTLRGRRGEDEKHGGPGADHIVGNLRSEKHFGGRGNDLIVDANSGRNPDVIRCGPGRDEVFYSKGFDKVAEDCELLKPYPKRWWTP